MREIDGYLLNDRETKDCISLIRGNSILISAECAKTLRHILDARIDNARDISAYYAWTSARDIVEYALANNLEGLSQFDYYPTAEDADFEKEW